MLDQLDREVFPSGETVFSKGDAGDCAYLIQEGSVEVIANFQDREVRISTIGQGELFGEVALIDQRPRTATVRTLEKTVLVPIPRSMVQELLAKSDPVLRHLLLVILDRFRRNQADPLSTLGSEIPEAEYSQRREIRGEATQRLALAHSMTRALAHNDEFHLHYQPICVMATGEVAGYEALIRWQHPSEGMIPPMDFLWLAEQTGLIHQLGIWTLKRASQDWKTLRQCTAVEHPFICVNLSASQLISETLVDDVNSIVSQYNIDATELKLELTESMMVEQPELALRILSRLIELGCSLSLDDYGTGYSGLNHLQSYPIGTLKIDRSFVGPMLESPQSMEIVQSSIALAHSLKMKVVAEGVETESVRLRLLQMGCDYGQGWLFGHPLSMQDHLAAMQT
jgi:EAL domain-containing protein (putative c-di-GMP-specific phosphodiesterase class I)